MHRLVKYLSSILCKRLSQVNEQTKPTSGYDCESTHIWIEENIWIPDLGIQIR